MENTSRPQVSVNTMTRNEPFAFYALASLAPHVDEIILVDTGSDDKHWDSLYEAIKLFPNIQFYNRPLEADGHVWKVRNGEVKEANEEVGKQLGDIRRWMHAASSGDTVIILDGDEIYDDTLATAVVNFIKEPQFGFNSPLMKDKYAVHLPFFDFLSKTEIRLQHNMGRIFKKDKVEILSSYPYEMHHVKGLSGPQSCITNNHPNNFNWPRDGYVFHLEAIVKPWRKEIKERMPYNGIWPEVFERYKHVKEAKSLVEQYGF